MCFWQIVLLILLHLVPKGNILAKKIVMDFSITISYTLEYYLIIFFLIISIPNINIASVATPAIVYNM